MAERKIQRYFIERDNQDNKSEFGWDEFQATKYRPWEHQLASTILASWFVTTVHTEWGEQFPQDDQLAVEYETDLIPYLSVSNVRELLKAAMPLPQLSSQQTVELVQKHFINRLSSRRYRLRGDPRMLM